MLRRWAWFARKRQQTPDIALISVTADDIEQGVKRHSDRNPVALAIRRQVELANVHVGSHEVTVIRSWTPLDVDVVPLPSAIQAFLANFDAGRAVAPIRFKLRTAAAARPVRLRSDVSLLRLPAAERAIVERIQGKAEMLLGRAAEFPGGSREVFVVRQTLDVYLPDTVSAYLMLPADLTERAITAGGRTGRQVLRHALGVIEARLDAIAVEASRRQADGLLAQDRFLEDWLGDRPD